MVYTNSYYKNLGWQKIRQRFVFSVHGYFKELSLDYLNFRVFFYWENKTKPNQIKLKSDNKLN